jgi:hypothetical protein
MVAEILHYTLVDDSAPRMVERFREINVPLFDKYGIVLVDTWLDDDERVFSYLVEFPDRSARESMWSRYHSDPSYLDGKDEISGIITHVERHVFTTVLNRVRM